MGYSVRLWGPLCYVLRGSRQEPDSETSGFITGLEGGPYYFGDSETVVWLFVSFFSKFLHYPDLTTARGVGFFCF